MKQLLSNLFKYLALPLLLATIFFFWSLPRITTDSNFNSDELIYLSRSSYAQAYFSLDFKNSLWQVPWVVYDQPQLPNYVYALVPGDRSLINPQLSPCIQESNNKDSAYNIWGCLDGQPINSWPSILSPLKELIVRARTFATGISALVIASTYYLGLVVAGPLAGVLASLYLGFFSYFKNLSTMVMIDQILLLLLNLQLILALLLFRRRTNSFPLTLTLGLVTGLAFSAKISATIPSLILYLTLAFHSLRSRRIHFSSLLYSAILAFATFTLLHPFLWTNPVSGFFQMLSWRTTQIANQTSLIYLPTSILDKVVYSLSELFSSWKSTVNSVEITSIFSLFLISLLPLTFTRPAFAIPTLLNILVFVFVLPLKWNRYLLPLLPSISVILGSLPSTLAPLLYRIRHFLLGSLITALVLTLLVLLAPYTLLSVLIFTVSLLLILQGYFVTRAMLYNLSGQEENIPHSPPSLPFSLLIPAKNEALVIGRTLSSLTHLDYPTSLYEVLVITPAEDHATTRVVRQAIADYPHLNIRLIPIDSTVHSKASSLNLGLHFAKYDYVGIFDAEDEPHSAILERVNSYFLAHPDTHAVQAPVHLTNLNSNWYSSLNAVEYYFWFRSVLPFLATKKTIPLGGNTIFLHKKSLKSIGQYDEQSLTEDADLGIRLSSAKANIGIISDPLFATQEETPSNEIDLIRQRSRWDQGYLQVISKQVWRNLNLTQKFYTLYILSQPLFRHLSFLNMIFCPLLAVVGTIPVALALFSFIPAYFLLLQLGLYLLGLSDISRLHHIPISPLRYLITLLAFVPYQAILFLATSRALYKIWLGNYSWDKTTHYNTHRS